jgi:hypothetical protein
VHACLQAHRTQNWDRLRELFHPGARIATFAGGGMPGHPEKAISDLREAHKDLAYAADVDNIYEIDDFAAVLRGHVRHHDVDGEVVVADRAWLYVTLDGLLYRSQLFMSTQEAREAYDDLGLTLGVEDTFPAHVGVPEPRRSTA